MSTVERSVKLNDGNSMPVIGLGTFQGSYDYSSIHDTVVEAVKTAIDLGYRHFDTAALYDTEKPLGEAIRQKIQQGVVKREDLFVVTKLWCNSHRTEKVVLALRQSLQTLGLDYVDLYLVHWPVALQPGDEFIPKDEKGRVILDEETDITQTWKGMEECQRLGLTRSIGISNFNRAQIQRIIEFASIIPANLQVEVSPFFLNTDVVEFCKDHGIIVSCYSPLGKPGRPWKKDGDPLVSTDHTLNAVAKAHNKTPSQVALRFHLQRGLTVIPKSSNPAHLKENIDVFDFQLTEEEMRSITTNCGCRNFRVLYLREMFGHSKKYPFDEVENHINGHPSSNHNGTTTT